MWFCRFFFNDLSFLFPSIFSLFIHILSSFFLTRCNNHCLVNPINPTAQHNFYFFLIPWSSHTHNGIPWKFHRSRERYFLLLLWYHRSFSFVTHNNVHLHVIVIWFCFGFDIICARYMHYFKKVNIFSLHRHSLFMGLSQKGWMLRRSSLYFLMTQHIPVFTAHSSKIDAVSISELYTHTE